jgi:hypothetical protein
VAAALAAAVSSSRLQQGMVSTKSAVRSVLGAAVVVVQGRQLVVLVLHPRLQLMLQSLLSGS